MVFGFSTILDILPVTIFSVTICDLLPNCLTASFPDLPNWRLHSLTDFPPRVAGENFDQKFAVEGPSASKTPPVATSSAVFVDLQNVPVKIHEP